MVDGFACPGDGPRGLSGLYAGDIPRPCRPVVPGGPQLQPGGLTRPRGPGVGGQAASLPRSGPGITPFSASALSSSLPDDLLPCPPRLWWWPHPLLALLSSPRGRKQSAVAQGRPLGPASWVPILVPPSVGSVTLGKLLQLSVLRFPYYTVLMSVQEAAVRVTG